VATALGLAGASPRNDASVYAPGEATVLGTAAGGAPCASERNDESYEEVEPLRKERSESMPPADKFESGSTSRALAPLTNAARRSTSAREAGSALPARPSRSARTGARSSAMNRVAGRGGRILGKTDPPLRGTGAIWAPAGGRMRETFAKSTDIAGGRGLKVPPRCGVARNEPSRGEAGAIFFPSDRVGTRSALRSVLWPPPPHHIRQLPPKAMS
jgi:hypothetical protein